MKTNVPKSSEQMSSKLKNKKAINTNNNKLNSNNMDTSTELAPKSSKLKSSKLKNKKAMNTNNNKLNSNKMDTATELVSKSSKPKSSKLKNEKTIKTNNNKLNSNKMDTATELVPKSSKPKSSKLKKEKAMNTNNNKLNSNKMDTSTELVTKSSKPKSSKLKNEKAMNKSVERVSHLSLEEYLERYKNIKPLSLKETIENPYLANERNDEKKRIRQIISKMSGEEYCLDKPIKSEQKEFHFKTQEEALETLNECLKNPFFKWYDQELLNNFLRETLRSDINDINYLKSAINNIDNFSVKIWVDKQLKNINTWSKQNAETITNVAEWLNQPTLERKTKFKFKTSKEAYEALVISDDFDCSSLQSIHNYLSEMFRDEFENDELERSLISAAVNYMDPLNDKVLQWFYLQSQMPENWSERNFEIINLWYNDLSKFLINQ